jgi:excisionase family DNA binding protein
MLGDRVRMALGDHYTALTPATRTYYDTRELADLLRCSPKTVRRYVRRGWLKPTRVGRRLLVSSEQVQALLEQGERPIE